MKNLGFGINMDEANKLNKLANEENGFSKINWFVIPKGTSVVRILPPWSQKGLIALPVISHRIEYNNPEGFTRWNWNCNKETFGTPCKICEGLEKLKAVGVNTEPFMEKGRVYYANAIIVTDPGYNGTQGYAPGTHVLIRLPWTVYSWIINQVTNPLIGDITSIEKGISIFITKEGSGLKTTYSCTLSPNGREPIDPAILDKIDDLYNLDDIFKTDFSDEDLNGLLSSIQNATSTFSDATPITPVKENVQQNMFNPNISTGFEQMGTTVNESPTLVKSQEVTASSKKFPECFGKYNPTEVNCVICEFENECKKGF